ncbi:Uma2 family endonuclease [Phormidium pseudopriestleyi FRX01]|uniref:Uma2 family endonuclease n=1 Tax=Phormidium pseudopriestleyi FRX01 TaxID=1759528 RepID=A0ABS3FUP3_9CYAN|nr:Uma2 family endonuclease [Phormidium pseudopriestleyi]MBO0350853.1 Uma2 family endonuclease [Phormidium pseudopriestleyi FRX01]
MIANPDRNYMSPEEYLEWEEKQPLKHEYMNGEIIAMTGGTIAHNEIAINLTMALKNHLRGKGCKVLMADSKLEVSESGPFHYPDVMVTCNEQDKLAKTVINFPCLIAEVLSPGTEGFDRGQKFQNYRQISTLREYLLVSANQKMVECFRLNEKGLWELSTYGEGDEIELASVEFRIPIDLIYEEVVFSEN